MCQTALLPLSDTAIYEVSLTAYLFGSKLSGKIPTVSGGI